jgi:hypothetical protein
MANGMISNCDVLTNLFESIERFIDRLKAYIEVPRTPTVNKITVNLTVELISTLALVTQKLKQRQHRGLFLADMLPCSKRHSQIGKEFFRGQGHQGGPAEVGPDRARSVLEYRNSDS